LVTPAIGAVVLVRFPFSDLTDSKLRPAVVLADAGRDDWILCQITSQQYTDTSATKIVDGDFVTGSLLKTSYARPTKLFTANTGIMTKAVGDLKDEKLDKILLAVISLFKRTAIDV
jgi:mRNA interferase MazF